MLLFNQSSPYIVQTTTANNSTVIRIDQPESQHFECLSTDYTEMLSVSYFGCRCEFILPVRALPLKRPRGVSMEDSIKEDEINTTAVQATLVTNFDFRKFTFLVSWMTVMSL